MSAAHVYGLSHGSGPVVYIGSTCRDIRTRIAQHLKDSENSYFKNPVYHWIRSLPQIAELSCVHIATIHDDTDRHIRWLTEKAIIERVARRTLIEHGVLICNVRDNPFRGMDQNGVYIRRNKIIDWLADHGRPPAWLPAEDMLFNTAGATP